MIRIPKNGMVLHHYCDKCKGDELHLINVAQYKVKSVVYHYWCITCWEKWNVLKKIAEKLPIEIPEKFYGNVGEMSGDKWEEFIKWSKDE